VAQAAKCCFASEKPGVQTLDPPKKKKKKKKKERNFNFAGKSCMFHVLMGLGSLASLP
jgi:hypothetical protein